MERKTEGRAAERVGVLAVMDAARLRGYQDAQSGKPLSNPAIDEPLAVADAYYEGFMAGKGEQA